MPDFSQTAYLIALLRALESERDKALFQDPLARRLAGREGAIMAELLPRKAPIINAIAIRTRVVDDFIGVLVASAGVDTILNLAAGLDTRPYRLALPSSLRWIEVDLPALLTQKEALLQNEQPVCHLQRVTLDLTDIERRRSFFETVNASAKRVLVLSEGLLGYWSETQVAALATVLYDQTNFHWWLFELVSAAALPWSALPSEQRLLDDYLRSETPSLQFAPAQGAVFFQAYGWDTAHICSGFEAMRRFKRLSWWAIFLQLCARSVSPPCFQKLAAAGSIVLLQRQGGVDRLVGGKGVDCVWP